MSEDSVFSLLLGIPIGIVSGLYTGLIVTRYARFAELRNEILRIIRNIEFIYEMPNIHFKNESDLSKLMLISSDLLFLHHRIAGEQVAKLSREIQSSNDDARYGGVDINDYFGRHNRWQATARNLSPNMFVICSLWGKLWTPIIYVMRWHYKTHLNKKGIYLDDPSDTTF